MFGLGFCRARLVVARIEPMLPDIGGAREDLMHRGDAPPSAVAGTDVALVEIGGDRLDPHRAAVAVTIERQPVDQAHSVGVDRIDLQLLLYLRAALLSGDDAITDRRQRAGPIAPAPILLPCAPGV